MGLFGLLRRLFGGGGDENGSEPSRADGYEYTGGPTIPSVYLEPGMDLDAAHERAVEAFDEAGYHVTEGTILNSVDRPLEETTKLFNFHDDDGMYTGVVYTGGWDDEVVDGVLSLASSVRPDPADGVFVVSAAEPPDAVSYVTGAHPRSAFVLESMVEVQNGPELGPESAEHYADVGRDLLSAYFDVQVDADDLDALETIDEVVLSELRPVENHERPHDGFVPYDGLVPVGALAGEVMRRGFEREHGATVSWTGDVDVSSTGVALSVSVDGEEMTVNPIGKAFKLFESGSSDSLAFMYQTSVGVMQNEL